MTGLNIAPGLDLPLEAVTETFVILAKRGSGKTYSANVMAEEMIGAGHPVVIVDPIGVWWGLRASADGKADGLPVAIFGGDHADVPLDENSGTVIADAIVAERFSAILDLSLLSKSAARRFMTAFIERLYHRNRDPLHVFIDEADSFAPQRATADGARLLGAMEDLVRRGRARGIGCTLITQRPAVLHKDVLSQAEVLICLRMTGVRDVAAIDEWIKLHDVDDQAAELKGSLPSLPVGTAWIWSPGWLERLDRVQIRTRTTFDSSATPKIGQTRIVPKQMADIDLNALGEKIAASAESVKANDPRELRKRITILERELSAQPPAAEPVIERVEVPLLSDDDRKLLHKTIGLIEGVALLAKPIHDMIARIDSATTPVRQLGSAQVRHVPATPARPTARPAAERSSAAASGSAAGLSKAARLVVSVLAQHGTCNRTKLALLAGYSSKGGGFNNALSSLRTAGLIAGSNDGMYLTDDGETAAAGVPPLPAGRDLVEHWRSTLGGGAPRVVFDTLIAAWPDALDREQLAERAGYAPTGGGFNNAISKLRTLGLLIGNREGMTVADEIGEA